MDENGSNPWSIIGTDIDTEADFRERKALECGLGRAEAVTKVLAEERHKRCNLGTFQMHVLGC